MNYMFYPNSPAPQQGMQQMQPMQGQYNQAPNMMSSGLPQASGMGMSQYLSQGQGQNLYQNQQQGLPFAALQQDDYNAYDQDQAGFPNASIPYSSNASVPTALPNGIPAQGYAKGGRVQDPRGMAEMLRQHGQREDTVLAHINPQEAALLEENFGGDINPHTGLPQYGLFSNPMKWLAGSGFGTAGALIGNHFLPGLGGIIGGALGGAAGSAIRGRKDYLQAGLRGAGQGAIIPSLASGAGWVANNTGAPGIGADLSKYGDTNAIMPALDRMFSGSAAKAAPGLSGGKSLVTTTTPLANRFTEVAKGSTTVPGVAEAASKVPDASTDFMGSLMGKSKNFASDPANLLAAAGMIGPWLMQEKPKSATQLGEDDRKRALASLYSPEELARIEAQDLEKARGRRRIERGKYLDEEKMGNMSPVYQKRNTPEEERQRGRWIEHYSNPEFTGAPLYFNEGGAVPQGRFEEEMIEYPSGIGYLLGGNMKGQSDTIDMNLPEGAYVVDASTMADLGDGNPVAGFQELERGLGKELARTVPAKTSSKEGVILPGVVKALGKGSTDKGAARMDKTIKNIRKHKGGSVKLPPKAKSLEKYMR